MALWSQLSSKDQYHWLYKKSSRQSHVKVQNKSLLNVMQRLDSVQSTFPGSTGEVTSYKEGYWYDSNNRSIGYYSLQWNDVNMAMDTNYKEIYSYDGNGRIQEIQTWNFDGSSIYLFSRNQMTYDNLNNITVNFEDLWDDVANSWFPNQQISYTYNAQNSVTQELMQSWDSNLQQWQDISRTTNTYEGNVLTVSISEYFDTGLGSWIPMSQNLFSYSPEGLMIEDEFQFYDEVSTSWAPSNLVTYTYNSSNQLESMLYSSYDDVLLSYYPMDQTNYIHDNYGNVVQEVSIDPNDPFNPFFRQNYVFDNAFAYSDLILPYYIVQEIPDFFTHKLLNLNVESWDGVQWNVESNADLFYSQQVVSVISEALQSHEIIIYPNPASSQLTIKTSGSNLPAMLFDSNGSCIQRQKISGIEQVDISTLSSGVYHWLINGKVYTFVK